MRLMRWTRARTTAGCRAGTFVTPLHTPTGESPSCIPNDELGGCCDAIWCDLAEAGNVQCAPHDMRTCVSCGVTIGI